MRFLLAVAAALSALHVCQGLDYCVAPDASLDCGSCPVSNAPCHTLQYYAANSNFTSNAVFYFLEGEHALDTVVEVTNVANLSLASMHQDSSQVVCGSASAGFFVENFVDLSVENLSFLNCGADHLEYRGAFILASGSGLIFNHVTTFNTSGYDIAALSVEADSSITNCIFSAENQGSFNDSVNVLILYSNCLGPSQLSIDSCKFLNGQGGLEEDIGTLTVQVNCTGVNVDITNSVLSGTKGANLYVNFMVFTGNFVDLSNIIISNGSSSAGPAGVHIVLDENLPDYDPLSCGYDSLRRPHDLIEISDMIMTKSGAFYIEDNINPEIECNAQYISMRNSAITECSSTKESSSVFFSARDQFRTIRATFENVSLSGALFGRFEGAILFQQVLNVTFISCRFENNLKTAIKALGTNLIFEGNNTFRNNRAYHGGGIVLFENSYIFLNRHTHILFSDNHADYRGGAIYVLKSGGMAFQDVDCFFQADLDYSDIRIDFINNTARKAGSSLYIPSTFDFCNTKVGKESGSEVFEMIFILNNTESDPSAIASDPVRICSCEHGHQMPICDPPIGPLPSRRNGSTYPGRDFSLRLAVVGAMNGAVPGVILQHQFENFHLGFLQETQENNHAHCENFNYTIFTEDPHVILHLTAGRNLAGNQFQVFVTLRECPLGFSLNNESKSCGCDPFIDRDSVHCFINNQSIERPANTWIGFINESTNLGVVFIKHCPHGYCSPNSVALTRDDPDIQCVENRTGVLCGQCSEGYSLTLGSQKCSECSHMYLLLLLPLAALGPVLVAVLFLLNLTVTEGSINGLIFYANVVSMSHSIQYLDTRSPIYTFIAWLNLDLGIPTCFYDGMDAYVETWLQFAFPLYLWMIIAVIIFLFNKFPRLIRRGTQDAVKVLATLLLLSYTKLQRTLVTIFSFTTLKYSSGVVHYVWLYDANVQYLKGKHLILFMAGVLVLLFLILPYTFALTFFQCLQACSAHRVCRWVNRLKPVFDSYAGPYKDRYRMWTGLLLVTRTVLLILFSFNFTGSPNFNYFVILVTSLALLLLSTRRIYKKWPHDILESFFYVQLGIFSGDSIYSSLSGGNISVLAGFSFGTSFLVFLLILVYRFFCFLQGVCPKHKGCGTVESGEDQLLFRDRDEATPDNSYEVKKSDTF